MNKGGLLGRMGASGTHFYELVGAASEGSSVIRRAGVIGCICPAVPERSIFNSVAYSDPLALTQAMDDLSRAYANAGVRAWMVWVASGDRDTAKQLAKAGFGLVARPRAMGMALASLPEPDPGDLQWTDRGSIADLASVNDGAYGYPSGTFQRGLANFSTGQARIYQASTSGAPAAALMTVDYQGDCGVFFVATSPEHQGAGLMTRLLNRALADGRERGCDTATLAATSAGRGVYERLGFVDLGGLQVWELRA